MGTIAFAYKNRCLESGVTFTPSSEAAAHDADNLGKAHPSKFWRLTTLTGDPHVIVNLVDVYQINLIAPLYVTGSGHRNWLKKSNTLSSAAWTATNASVNKGNLITGAIREWAINEGVASGVHNVSQTYTKPNEALEVTVSCYVEEDPSRHFELYVEGATSGDNASVQIDLTDGSINASGANGNFSGFGSATTTAVTGNWHRVSFVVTTDTHTALTVKLKILDGSFTESYAGGSQTIDVGGPMVELSGLVGDFIDSKLGSATLWGYDDDGTTSGPSLSGVLNFALGRDVGDWRSAQGWVHSYKYDASGFADDNPSIYFYDAGNEDSQLDISNIYIGPTWSPTKNLRENWEWGFDQETGGRTLRIDIPYASEADAMADAMPMALRQGVGVKSAAVADGGAEFRAGKEPILVILDPDEATYAQEQMIYGYVDEFKIRANKFIANMDGNGNSGLAYQIELTIKEVLP